LERAVADFVTAAGLLVWARHDQFRGHRLLTQEIELRTATEIPPGEVTCGWVSEDEHGAVARVGRLGRGATNQQVESLIRSSFPQLKSLEIEFSA
jgi:hypothetical protein